MKRPIFPTPQDAEAAFYDAFEKTDLEAMMAVWADDDIICVHPGGTRLAGVAEVRESWRQIFAGGQQLQFQLRHRQSVRAMMVAMHSLYEYILIVGEAQPRVPVIATNIYLNTDFGWRMVMHHASPAPASAAAESPSDIESESDQTPKTLH